MPSNTQIGHIGEQLARNFLSSQKYEIIACNERTKYGEIDIIARKDHKIAFIEVKTRIGSTHGMPYEAITPRKLAHLENAVRLYVLKKKLQNYKLSLQAVSIVLKSDLKVLRIDHFEDLLL